VEQGGQLLGTVIFMAAWVAGVASWFLAVAESIGMWRFSGWVFRSGLVVLAEERIVPNPSGRLPSHETIETANGKFRFVGPSECLFRSQFRMFTFQVHTPFPLKGSIRWSGDHAHIKGRIPIFTAVFIGAWLVGWTAGSLMAIASGSEGAGFGVPFLVIGFAAVGGTTAFSLPFEKRRSRSLVGELEALISTPAAQQAVEPDVE
jgi:hypothetical protein